MKRFSFIVGMVSCLASMGTMMSVAEAQALYSYTGAPPERQHTVLDRPRPDYQPRGIHSKTPPGNLYGTLGVAERYTDNAQQSKTSTHSDVATVATSSFGAHSDWNRHYAGLSADGMFLRFADQTSENQDHYGATARGRLDIRRSLALDASAGYRHTTEERTDANAVASAARLSEFDQQAAGLGITWKPNRTALFARVDSDRYTYDDNALTNGTPIDNGDRDRREQAATLGLGYDLQPADYTAFLETTVRDIDYDRALDSDGLNRDARGLDIRVGARGNFTDIILGDLHATYFNRDYEAASLSDLSGLNYGIDLNWNITRRTTLGLGAGRALLETIEAGAAGIDQHHTQMRLEHELRRNILLTASGGYITRQFEGTTREEELYTAHTGAEYALTHHLSVGLAYDYGSRAAATSADDFAENRITLSLRGAL